MAQGLIEGNDNACDFMEKIKSLFALEDIDPNTYSPITLAYIGDCVYELVIRTVITMHANCPANILNKQVVWYVKAVNQAIIYDLYMEDGVLSSEEASILRRGRNAKSATVAKHASVGDYRKATAVEALVGYLYLKGRSDRLIELIKLGMEKVAPESN